MNLLELAVAARLAAPVFGDGQRLGNGRLQIAELALGQFNQFLVIDLARRRDHHGIGGVVAAHVAGQGVTGKAGDGLDRAENRAADRLVRIGRFLQQIEHQIVGRVLDLADLLDDDAALALQFDRIEGRALQDVAQQIDRKRHVLTQHAGVVGSLLARRIGVQMAPHVLDGLGDVAGRAIRGALEGHVLEHVGDAVLLDGFGARANADPDADGRRLQPVHGLADDAQTIGQCGDFNAHDARAPMWS